MQRASTPPSQWAAEAKEIREHEDRALDEDDEDDDILLAPEVVDTDGIQLQHLLPHSDVARGRGRGRGRARDLEQPGTTFQEEDEDDPLRMISQAVPETDDPSLPTLTFRVMVIGTAFCITGAAVSQVR